MNKYEQIPDYTIDLHGYTTYIAEKEIARLMKNTQYKHIRMITGTGASRGGTPVLRDHIKRYLSGRGVRFNRAKQEHGGDGVLEVFLK
jgi:DNA-nicking Smr family endonuclease